MSFKEELTDKEIVLFLEHLRNVNDTDGFDAAYQAAVEKQREYPNCYLLALNTALTLDGLLLLSAEKQEKFDARRADIECLYQTIPGVWAGCAGISDGWGCRVSASVV